jgi:hypothetical protein
MHGGYLNFLESLVRFGGWKLTGCETCDKQAEDKINF